MANCDKTTCSRSADVLARYPDSDELRRYCSEHFKALKSVEYLRIHRVDSSHQ